MRRDAEEWSDKKAMIIWTVALVTAWALIIWLN